MILDDTVVVYKEKNKIQLDYHLIIIINGKLILSPRSLSFYCPRTIMAIQVEWVTVSSYKPLFCFNQAHKIRSTEKWQYNTYDQTTSSATCRNPDVARCAPIKRHDELRTHNNNCSCQRVILPRNYSLQNDTLSVVCVVLPLFTACRQIWNYSHLSSRSRTAWLT